MGRKDDSKIERELETGEKLNDRRKGRKRRVGSMLEEDAYATRVRVPVERARRYFSGRRLTSPRNSDSEPPRIYGAERPV